MRVSSLSILVLSVVLISEVSPSNFFQMKNNKIYDVNGGERIFHGVNVVIKVPPYYQNLTESDFIQIKSYGLNGIRLGVMWPGVQPKENQFNETYLKIMIDIVKKAGEHNIYTLVEFHQDLFSQKFCGDGVPVWAIPKQVYQSFPIPLTLRPAPGNCNKTWPEYYATLAVNKGFGHLWKNKHGLLDKFATYWKKVAQAFKGNQYVIGFELMNQPWPGNMYENPLVMVPGLSQLFHLQNSYDFLASQIRKVDPDQNICYQPVTWLNNFRSGFTHPPGGYRFSNSSIFCYHYYSPPTLHLKLFMKARMIDLKRLGGAGILTQFYTINDAGANNVPMMEQCDAHSQSWFGWIYQQKKKLIPQIKRTFSHRVAGTIINQSFNNITKEYILLYHPDPHAGNTTIYFDTASDYANNFDVHIYPTLSKAKYTVVDNIYLTVDSSQFQNGIIAMITISQ